MDFIIKHPIVTFLIVSEVCGTVENVVAYLCDAKKRKRTDCVSRVCDAIDDLSDEYFDKKKQKEKQIKSEFIGFR